MPVFKVIVIYCFIGLQNESNAQALTIHHKTVDIDSFPLLKKEDFDSIFHIKNNLIQIKVLGNPLPDTTWYVEGKLIDYIEGIGCGCILCSCGTGKVLLNNTINEYVYIVFGLKEKFIISQSNRFRVKVRHLAIEDIKNFIIFNKFDTLFPFYMVIE
jgi:hypothetical protein